MVIQSPSPLIHSPSCRNCNVIALYVDRVFVLHTRGIAVCTVYAKIPIYLREEGYFGYRERVKLGIASLR